MTNKAQTMLTIALTFAVTVLITDRMIEPAHAQACATSSQVRENANYVVNRVLDCMLIHHSGGRISCQRPMYSNSKRG